MKIKFVYISLLLVTSFAAKLCAQETSFKGLWKRNSDETKISAGLSINSLPTQIQVFQDKKELSFKRTLVTASGQVTVYTEKFTPTGKFLSSEWRSERKKVVEVKWSEDKKTLMSIATYLDATGKVVQTLDESWSLTGEGKILRISSKMEIQGNPYWAETVFVKVNN